jgi:hypothetical protein
MSVCPGQKRTAGNVMRDGGRPVRSAWITGAKSHFGLVNRVGGRFQVDPCSWRQPELVTSGGPNQGCGWLEPDSREDSSELAEDGVESTLARRGCFRGPQGFDQLEARDRATSFCRQVCESDTALNPGKLGLIHQTIIDLDGDPAGEPYAW